MHRTPEETLRILKRLDVDAVLPGFLQWRASVGATTSRRDDGTEVDPREVCLASLHKARLTPPNTRIFSGAEKRASRAWLQANGYKVPGANA